MEPKKLHVGVTDGAIVVADSWESANPKVGHYPLTPKGVEDALIENPGISQKDAEWIRGQL